MGICCASPVNMKVQQEIESTTASTQIEFEAGVRGRGKSEIKQYTTRSTMSYDTSPSTKASLELMGSNKSSSLPSNPDIKEESEQESSFTPSDDNAPPQSDLQIPEHKSEFQLRMEQRQSEIQDQRKQLRQLQSNTFEEQVAAQRSKSFKRLYDVWTEYASADGSTMDIEGLTAALAVFGMIINTHKEFQKHIFGKFDLDDEKVITYNDFSATMASFVGSTGHTDDDSLQTLFEIFDIDQDGYLKLEDVARILLTQNQIATVCTGSQQQEQETAVVYSKQQCLKQAAKMISRHQQSKQGTGQGQHKQLRDGRVHFEDFKVMMNRLTDHDMLIAHMKSVSMTHGSVNSVAFGERIKQILPDYQKSE